MEIFFYKQTCDRHYMIIWSDAILGFPCHNSEHVPPQNSSGRSSPNAIFPLAELVQHKNHYICGSMM